MVPRELLISAGKGSDVLLRHPPAGGQSSGAADSVDVVRPKTGKDASKTLGSFPVEAVGCRLGIGRQPRAEHKQPGSLMGS